MPVLNARNPYRNTAFMVKRRQARGRKQQKGANPFGRNPIFNLGGKFARAIKKSRKKQQKGGNTIYPLFGPMVKFLKKSRRSRKRKQQTGEGLRRRRKQQRGEGLWAPAVKLGVKLGKSKNYRRMSLSGFSDTGGRRYRKPWQV